MIKIVCLAALVGFTISCKTAKNYVVAKESYEIINLVEKHYVKQKEAQIYYKTYGIKYPSTYSEDSGWDTYINFNQLAQNRIPKMKIAPKRINFQEYLTEADLEYMREQSKNQTSVKWIKNRLAPNIKLYRDTIHLDVAKRTKRGLILPPRLNIYSEPVFSIDKRIALIYSINGGGGGRRCSLTSKKKEDGNC